MKNTIPKQRIFWFRRDLRWHDNHALLKALETSEDVIPVFIFDPNILGRLEKNDKRVSLLFDRIKELNALLENEKQIHILYGDPSLVFKRLFKEYNIDSLFCNEDYEPYALERDQKVSDICQEKGISFHQYKDHLIFHKDEILSLEGNPYSVYTPYMKRWMQKYKENPPRHYLSENLLHKVSSKKIIGIQSLSEIGFQKTSYHLLAPKLHKENLTLYEQGRDVPSLETSQISVHLRFGMLSVREVAKIAFEHSSLLLREVVWRSFFAQILWHNPRVISQPFRAKYNSLEWNNEDRLELWKTGATGFPIIDAGMRQLNETGYMHNRVRMLTASFLVKNMGIDWRHGEHYFAAKLMDFDLASNNGNWQWVAGTGCDAAPYFRIFNPVSQQAKFDPNFTYCKRHIKHFDHYLKNNSPILDLKKTRLESIERYKQCLANEKS